MSVHWNASRSRFHEGIRGGLVDVLADNHQVECRQHGYELGRKNVSPLLPVVDPHIVAECFGSRGGYKISRQAKEFSSKIVGHFRPHYPPSLAAAKQTTRNSEVESFRFRSAEPQLRLHRIETLSEDLNDRTCVNIAQPILRVISIPNANIQGTA